MRYCSLHVSILGDVNGEKHSIKRLDRKEESDYVMNYVKELRKWNIYIYTYIYIYIYKSNWSQIANLNCKTNLPIFLFSSL